MNDVRMDREELHRRLDLWLDGVATKKPRIDDGEQHEFHLEGWVEGYDNEGNTLACFALSTKRTETGL